jgi:hypothetical protein
MNTQPYLLIVIILAFFSCTGDSATDIKVVESSKVSKPVPFDTIVADTTLFGVDVKTWNRAPIELRKMNCGGLVLKQLDTIAPNDLREFSEVSIELFKCIDETTYGMPTMNNHSIESVSYSCLYAMGYDEKLDSAALNRGY